jgi:DNA segregation ATPase FtsK/SpoIIIE-like protein
MDHSSRYKTLRIGLREIQRELLSLRNSLSDDFIEGRDNSPFEEMATVGSDLDTLSESEDFFAHLINESPIHEEEELYHAAIKIITERGYASTLVLQQRLGITYRQAMNLIDRLEEDGLIGPAHGFRPHKALSAAYSFPDRAS